MEYRILVPSGIGDFHWLWSKLSTTNDKFIVEYADMVPDRLKAFLALLPQEKISSYKVNRDYRCIFDTAPDKLEMRFLPETLKKVQKYSDLDPHALNAVEANTHLENGNRIEYWLPDIPEIDFHYQINGLPPSAPKQDIFLVHLSSFKVHGYWKYYEIEQWIKMVSEVQFYSGWTPVFVGAEYDDFAQATFQAYKNEGRRAISLIGCTPDLLSSLLLIQQSRFFMGAVSSGLTMLANCLRVPSASWWPRPKLAPSWPDLETPYIWFLWKDAAVDTEELINWLRLVKP